METQQSKTGILFQCHKEKKQILRAEKLEPKYRKQFDIWNND